MNITNFDVCVKFALTQKGIDGDFTEIYDKIMATLSEKFGVGNQRAAELSYISDRTTYTIALMDIADPEWRDRVRGQRERFSGQERPWDQLQREHLRGVLP